MCPLCLARSCKVVWTRVCCVSRYLADSTREVRQMHYTRLVEKNGREFVTDVVEAVNALLQARREKLAEAGKP